MSLHMLAKTARALLATMFHCRSETQVLRNEPFLTRQVDLLTAVGLSQRAIQGKEGRQTLV